MGGDFGEPVGSGLVVAARHDRRAAERGHGIGDAVIVGGDDDGADGAGVGHALVHVLDHGLAADEYERFAGKSSGTES
jgi:hypothetical protein